MEKRKSITIGLMGHSFHCTNLGVGALAVSECEILKKIADDNNIDLRVICFESGIGANDFRNATDVNVELQYYTYGPGMIKKFKKCDLIIDVTGGDSFADIYGSKVFLVGILLKFYALLGCKNVVLAPQTIGPFKSKVNKAIANFYMSFVKHIFLRDEISAIALNKNNCKKMKNTADMAFLLPYEKTDKGNGQVGINISGLLYDTENALLRNSQLDYQRFCHDLIELLTRYGKEIVLVSHVIGDEKTITDNDYYASLKVKEKYPHVEISPVFSNPVEAKSFISGLDFFIGARMHAVIAAVSSGVPAIPIAYSRKFKGVFEPVGYNESLDALTLSENDILEKIEYWLINEDELRMKVSKVQENAEKRLSVYEKFLESLIIENIK